MTLRYCRDCGSPDWHWSTRGEHLRPYLLDLEGGDICVCSGANGVKAAEVTVPAEDPRVEAYRTALAAACLEREGVEGVDVRCGVPGAKKDCGAGVGSLYINADGTLLRSYTRDRGAEAALKQHLAVDHVDVLDLINGTELGEIPGGFPALAMHVWLLEYPPEITGPITVECLHHKVLVFDRDRAISAARKRKTLFLGKGPTNS